MKAWKFIDSIIHFNTKISSRKIYFIFIENILTQKQLIVRYIKIS